MSDSFMASIGAEISSVEFLDFAKDALSGVSLIAVDLGARTGLCFAGCLAAKLLIARAALESVDDDELPRLQRRVPKLLEELERVSSWPEQPDPSYQTLRAVTKSHDKRVNERVQRAILNFAKSSPHIVKQYCKNLDGFSKQFLAADDLGNVRKKIPGLEGVVKEYPARVNAELYRILKSHSQCSCLATRSPTRARHHGRLRLRENIAEVDGYVEFDMLFSASPSAWDHWQDLQLRVSTKKQNVRTIKFNTEGSVRTSNDSINTFRKKIKVVQPNEFCNLVKTKVGCRICCQVEDSELRQLYDGFPVVQDVESGPSFSLKNVLDMGRLSNRMKLVLAYIVAKSYWQYYDSQWMDSPWTSDSIHFLREPQSEIESGFNGALFASKPYLVIEFSEHDSESAEYCGNFGVIFRYPRLLSLCIMLIEIGRGQSLRFESHSSVAANLNAKWDLAKRLTGTSRAWGEFDYPHYRNAIRSCLAFAPLEQDIATVEKDVFARKAAIHNSVVQPLEDLLNQLGFAENLHVLDPIDTIQEYRGASEVPPAPIMPAPTSEVDMSVRWLDEINAINRFFSSRVPPTTVSAPRVAILDTGLDDESVFFNMPGRRQRIKGWRDWVDRCENPVDDNGHGTHTTATVMKVAPYAMVYAARVAKDRNGLKNAAHVIIEAISWAVNEVKADIVTMCFGFENEIPSITEAIMRAILDRKGKILFFAAASNSGGNRREMFPANLDYVLSIRETNSRGAFSDTNPPVDPNGPAVFGTLGRDVPSAWLSSVEGEIAKSGSSVATAVAAGIAAMLIRIAVIGIADPAIQMPVAIHKLWTKRGMQNVLVRMSQNMGNRSYFISPMGFFVGKDPEKAWTSIADACSI